MDTILILVLILIFIVGPILKAIFPKHVSFGEYEEDMMIDPGHPLYELEETIDNK
jgi:hypothetical protein